MSTDLESKLAWVLEKTLGKLADEETGELSEEDALRVSRTIRETLALDDCWLNSREPYVIADFICQNVEGRSMSAAARLVDSLTDQQVADLMWEDVFQSLQAGQYKDIDGLANENYLEKNAPQAAAIATTIVDGAIASLAAMTDCRKPGGDSGLVNLWEEVCVQMQGEKSLLWDGYLDTINSLLSPSVDALNPDEKHSLWLATDGGWEWQFDEDQREADPLAFNTEEMVDSLKDQLLANAGEFRSTNIRSFLGGVVAAD